MKASPPTKRSYVLARPRLEPPCLHEVFARANGERQRAAAAWEGVAGDSLNLSAEGDAQEAA